MKSDERQCPKCAEKIKKVATVCKHCGSNVEAEIESDEDDKKPSKWLIALAIFLLLALIGKIMGPSEDFQKKYPRGGLTEEQYLEIAADCAKNPDALRCR